MGDTTTPGSPPNRTPADKAADDKPASMFSDIAIRVREFTASHPHTDRLLTLKGAAKAS
jgi:hypothetical protein